MFQLVTGQVPSDNVPGVFLEALSDIAQVAGATTTRQLPWRKFPPNMPLLQDLINWMTQKDREQRPRIKQVLEHQWFSAKTNADLPPASLARLREAAVDAVLKSRIAADLDELNNLDEVRNLLFCLQAERGPKSTEVSKHTLTTLLVNYGASPSDVDQYCKLVGNQAGLVPYKELLGTVIVAKTTYMEQACYEMFREFDLAGDGVISEYQAQALMADKEAFGDMDPSMKKNLLARMEEALDQDGYLSFDEFARILIQDGRMERRSMCTDIGRPNPCNFVHSHCVPQ